LVVKHKKRGPTWSDVKSRAVGLDHRQLVQIVGDLYRLSKENEEFLNARFGVLDDPLAPFKKSIEEFMYPDIFSDKPVQISKAKAAIRRYSKAVGDINGEAELKTFFVECGNRFTVEYGDQDEGFYIALNIMYKEAIDKILSLPVEQRNEFRERLEEIMESSRNIGWGYHDDLRADYYEAFPEDE
jgi:hypothetical protein